jgi:hypothetical protein
MMNTKIPSAIEKIKLNAATFSGVEVEPTLINFFYGKRYREIDDGAGDWLQRHRNRATD